jgi:hypothetical protein
VDTLRHWLRHRPDLGLPTPLRLGNRLFFIEAELQAWLTSRREEGLAHA